MMQATIPTKQAPSEAITLKHIAVQEVEDLDILLGKGQDNLKHWGNIAYRMFIFSQVGSCKALNPKRRKKMVTIIIRSIHDSGGRFLTRAGKSDGWVSVDTGVAWGKVGQTVRNSLKANADFSSRSDDLCSSRFSQYSFAQILAYLKQEEYQRIRLRLPTMPERRSEPTEVLSKSKMTSRECSTRRNVVVAPAFARRRDKETFLSNSSRQELNLEYMCKRAAPERNAKRMAVASPEGLPIRSIVPDHLVSSFMDGFVRDPTGGRNIVGASSGGQPMQSVGHSFL
jgi:hypothetical protein